MEMSENIGELAKALSAAQALLSNAKKDTRADKYKYADLAQLIEISRGPLTSNNIALLQPVSSVEGKLNVSTVLIHSSGQWIKTTAELPQAVLHGGAGKNPIQVAGSAITYMRRYQLAGMLNIAQEDDDAAGYVAPKPKPQPKPQPKAQAPVLRDMPAEMFAQNSPRWISEIAAGKPLVEITKAATGHGLRFTKEQLEKLVAVKVIDDGYQSEGERQAHAMFGV